MIIPVFIFLIMNKKLKQKLFAIKLRICTTLETDCLVFVFFPICQQERGGNQLITKQLVALTFAVMISKQQQRGGVTERQLELRSVHNHNVGCNHATQSISRNDIYESVGSRNKTSLNFFFSLNSCITYRQR